MSSAVLFGCTQILLGVDALVRFQGLETVDQNMELCPSNRAMNVGWYLKATNRLLVGISSVALGALHLMAQCNVWNLGFLLACKGTLAPITMAGLVILIVYIGVEIVSTMAISYGLRGSFFRIHATDWTFQKQPDEEDDDKPFSFKPSDLEDRKENAVL